MNEKVREALESIKNKACLAEAKAIRGECDPYGLLTDLADCVKDLCDEALSAPQPAAPFVGEYPGERLHRWVRCAERMPAYQGKTTWYAYRDPTRYAETTIYRDHNGFFLFKADTGETSDILPEEYFKHAEWLEEILQPSAASDDEVKTVAKTLFDNYRGLFIDYYPSWDGLEPKDRDFIEGVAKAAIAAMDARADGCEWVDLEAAVERLLSLDIANSRLMAVRTAEFCAKAWNLKIKERKPCSPNT